MVSSQYRMPRIFIMHRAVISCFVQEKAPDFDHLQLRLVAENIYYPENLATLITGSPMTRDMTK